MAERPVNSEGDLTDKAFERLNLAVDAGQDITVNDLIATREAAMLSLADRLVQLPPVGQRSLYWKIGDGKDRIAVQTTPYISLSDASYVLMPKQLEEKIRFHTSDYYHFSHLIIAREGFFRLPIDFRNHIDLRELQNPFVINYESEITEEVATKTISTYNGLSTSVYRGNGNVVISTSTDNGFKKDIANPISMELGLAAFNQVDTMVRKYIKEKEEEEQRMIDLASNLDKVKNDNDYENEEPKKKRGFFGIFRGN